MESYSEKALAEVCGFHGIILTHTFLPSPSELKMALEAAEKPYREAERRFRTALAQSNDRMEAARIEGERKTRPTYEELIAKLPDSLRLGTPRYSGPMSPEAKAQFLAKYNVTQEELDKLPEREDQNNFSKLSAKPEAVIQPSRSPQAPSPAEASDHTPQ